ncbi:hypothetical protein SAMN05660964_00151 [Thiothrix caldifontis]|uniref:Uncharacterized protein n=1 Tax=Thiothrix caldifontis TaxID=525918 RepID=A0A1H3VLI8_9GAMM|nr:hypothetical protein SAMN05660964_00151 [Thiothrix caldifontis]
MRSEKLIAETQETLYRAATELPPPSVGYPTHTQWHILESTSMFAANLVRLPQFPCSTGNYQYFNYSPFPISTLQQYSTL